MIQNEWEEGGKQKYDKSMKFYKGGQGKASRVQTMKFHKRKRTCGVSLVANGVIFSETAKKRSREDKTVPRQPLT